MSILIYSFRTFPHLGDLPVDFVFGKLNQDLNTFTKLICEQRPDYILGIAKSPSSSSYIEQLAVNKFSRDKTIDRNGKSSYQLHIPTFSNFKYPIHPTNSFCNWTMYKISQYLEQSGFATKLMFVHLSANDLDEMRSLISLMSN